jgi:rod shape determining protein RodA
MGSDAYGKSGGSSSKLGSKPPSREKPSLRERWAATTNESMVRDSKIDWITITLLLVIILIGWFNLYSISRTDDPYIFAFKTYHGKEALFLLASFAVGVLILFLDTKFVEFVSYIAYGAAIFALLAVFVFSKVTNGASSWFEVGGIKIQPTEFAKVATLMALAKFMSRYNFNLKNRNDVLTMLGIVFLPMALVLLQNDAGSALVFMALVLVFFREGIHPLIMIGGLLLTAVGAISLLFSTSKYLPIYIGIPILLIFVFSWIYLFRRRFALLHLLGCAFLILIPFTVTKVVKPYQSARFRVLVASEKDMKKGKESDLVDGTDAENERAKQQKKDAHELDKVYYNYIQSLVAVGSGKVWGKGFGGSTHTRGDFVPEEQTDYIHSVFSEEHGFVGSTVLIILFFLLVARIIHLAENSKTAYARVFGYGVAVIFMIHITINIGMSIGVVPTIGIPLPFFSYGGSSVLSFTTMMFILMNHYSYRTNILT